MLKILELSDGSCLMGCMFCSPTQKNPLFLNISRPSCTAVLPSSCHPVHSSWSQLNKTCIKWTQRLRKDQAAWADESSPPPAREADAGSGSAAGTGGLSNLELPGHLFCQFTVLIVCSLAKLGLRCSALEFHMQKGLALPGLLCCKTSKFCEESQSSAQNQPFCFIGVYSLHQNTGKLDSV